MIYNLKAKLFLEKKQEEHFTLHGVYADVNSKIAEWMQEYTNKEIAKLERKVFKNFKQCYKKKLKK